MGGSRQVTLAVGRLPKAARTRCDRHHDYIDCASKVPKALLGNCRHHNQPQRSLVRGCIASISASIWITAHERGWAGLRQCAVGPTLAPHANIGLVLSKFLAALASALSLALGFRFGNCSHISKRTLELVKADIELRRSAPAAPVAFEETKMFSSPTSAMRRVWWPSLT
jgi:hypothetical protein